MSRHEGTSTQRRKEKIIPSCGGERERERALWLLFLYVFSSPGPALCKLGLGRSAVLPEVLTGSSVRTFL